MLIQLAIRDYAIVERLDLDLHDGMTAITGETGAGKSIMLGALGLCLGERADAGSVRHGCERADISARFDIARLTAARAWLTERELAHDECLLRRVVTASGRSKAWINGQPVTVSDLKALGEHLIEVHSQHAHQALLREETHLRLLDSYAGQTEAVATLGEHFHHWRARRRRLRDLQESGDEVQARRQLLRYQVEELDQLALEEGELDTLEDEQTQLANLEEVLGDAQFAADCCDQDEHGARALLHHATARLGNAPEQTRQQLADALGMLNEAQIQIEEAARELHRFVDTTELDPQRLAEVEARLGEVHRIARKHHVLPEELRDLHQRLSDELASLEGDEHDLEALAEDAERARDTYREQARSISEARLEAARDFGEAVQAQLAFLGLGKATFEVAVAPRETPQAEGLDQVRFMISANPGQPSRPLNKVASGGELSRISLAIQVVAAQHSTAPSMVFDEVDVGVSGAIAEIVGQLLRRLGAQGQILTVTHLPQVAAQAHHHLHIEKRAEQDTTLTHMALLDDAGRVRELARMLGGVKLSDRTLAHAREMLDASQHAQH
ncbi:DNA replication and repair protein RecN [Chromohalobacter marismortui]|uniref:DNA repair protein RecN n=1 Tax=Chromohalobacter marismortui TaxID=42055 RepID=A0A4R7NEN3_9GAMM|nr:MULTISPECIES: DNA repair protein RecN [Chromohalobacter]MCI0510056.1 DNA repair protein RecN [Chromohalobacter sp.]MCI0593785.1 DNA repair protein RecN [Chromohalobacter sp.]TDU18975.1 DNA replication and repair protein RecN [Chromohalobacter marismortui]